MSEKRWAAEQTKFGSWRVIKGEDYCAVLPFEDEARRVVDALNQRDRLREACVAVLEHEESCPEPFLATDLRNGLRTALAETNAPAPGNPEAPT